MDMKFMLAGLVVVVSALSAGAKPPPPVERVEIRAEGLYVNGEPFFPVGITWAAHWHLSLPEAGEKGFNMVNTHGHKADPKSFRADVDDAYANGMYSAVFLSNGISGNLEQVEDIVLACRDAPGLLVWALEDEPNIRNPGPEDEGKAHVDLPYETPPEDQLPAYELIKRLDPHHPVWINLAYGYERDHRDYRHVADIHSDDTYPVAKFPLTYVAQFSDSVVKGAGAGADGKLGWMYVQMAPLRGGPADRPPTMTEVRCMTYMAVAHGISGISYFSFHYGGQYEGEDWTWWVNESSPGYWAQWADLTAELRTLAPCLVTLEAPEPLEVKIIKGNAGVTSVKTDMHAEEHRYEALHLSLRQTSSGYFLIAVNGVDEPIKARFELPVPEDGLAERAAVRFENRLVDVAEGVFEDSFGPYAVHLYEIPFRVEVDRASISWPRWQRRAGY
jgi:hypothetical protein